MNNFRKSACTSILIGKAATTDGSVIIGRNEDCRAAWPKHYVVHPRKRFNHSEYHSKANGFKIKLPKLRMKYDATPEWTDQFGTFEEDGINEANVAMSATESADANEAVLGADPLVKDGIGEEAMVTVVLPYVKSAREGVARLGQIIESHGTSEVNGVLFADANEAWYLETGSGHQWIAERIPDNCYAVVANQLAIQKVDFNDHHDFMWSPNLRKFVSQNHLNPAQDHSFNFRLIFGTRTLADTYYNTPRVWYGHRMFSPQNHSEPQSQSLNFVMKSSQKLSVQDAEAFLSSHYQGTKYDPLGHTKERHRFRPVSLAKTQESHVLQIRPDVPKEISGIHWLAMGVAAQSTYVPFFSGITTTPDEYHRGKHLYQTDSAYWIFKLAGILVDAHYPEFSPELKRVQKQLQIHYLNSIHHADAKIKSIPQAKRTALVNSVSQQNASAAMSAYRKLAAQLITRSTDDSPLNYHQDPNL